MLFRSAFGILENDYDRFFEKRIIAIHKELKKRIILQDSDEVTNVSLPSNEDTVE